MPWCGSCKAWLRVERKGGQSFTTSLRIGNYLVDAPDGSPATCTLNPSARDAEEVTITDIGLNADTQPITINVEGAETEDRGIITPDGEQSSYQIRQRGGSITLRYYADPDVWVIRSAAVARDNTTSAAAGNVAAGTGGSVVTTALVPKDSGDVEIRAWASGINSSANADVLLRVTATPAEGSAPPDSPATTMVVSAYSRMASGHITHVFEGLTRGVLYTFALEYEVVGTGQWGITVATPGQAAEIVVIERR